MRRRDHLQSALWGLAVTAAAYAVGPALLNYYVPDATIRSWGVVALMPTALIGGTMVYFAEIVARRPRSEPQVVGFAPLGAELAGMSRLINEGRDLLAHMPTGANDPSAPASGNEAFTQ